uniref:Uncharacterized protein n=1 Tax=Anguilla anguilla TaxID=7936 RepID=A0A0E9S6P2_ANGAN
MDWQPVQSAFLPLDHCMLGWAPFFYHCT